MKRKLKKISWLAVVLSLATIACSDMEPVESEDSLGNDEFASLSRICSNSSTPIAAAKLSASTVPTIQLDHTYGVRLLTKPNTTISSGALKFKATRSGVHTLYLGTPKMPTQLLKNDQAVDVASSAAIPASSCQYFRRAYTYNLQAGKYYFLEFGPISPQHWVRVHVEQPAISVEHPIVFAAALHGQSATDLYSIHADGTGLTRLTTTSNAERFPRWSPNYQQISYLRDNQLWVANANGSAAHVVAATVGRGLNGYSAMAWSPDGTRLIYTYPREPWILGEGDDMVDESYATTFHFVNADGTGDVALNEPVNSNPNAPVGRGVGSFYEPAWSSDGWIAFLVADDCADCAGGSQYYQIRENGANFKTISLPSGSTIYPRHDLDWSPTASNWVYTGNANDNYESPGSIYAGVAGATTATQLVNGSSFMPRWSADATKIAFLKAGGIFVMSANGSGQQQILTATGIRGLDW